jgi:hypothetical protein
MRDDEVTAWWSIEDTLHTFPRPQE